MMSGRSEGKIMAEPKSGEKRVVRRHIRGSRTINGVTKSNGWFRILQVWYISGYDFQGDWSNVEWADD